MTEQQLYNTLMALIERARFYFRPVQILGCVEMAKHTLIQRTAPKDYVDVQATVLPRDENGGQG